MNNVFEEIIKQLNEASFLVPSRNEDLYAENGLFLEDAVEIVEKAAKEYTSEINASNKNWIPCSQDNMPRIGQDVFATILSSKGEYYTDTLRYCRHNCGEDKWRLRRNDSLIPASKVVAWEPLFLPESYIPNDKQNDFKEEPGEDMELE